jgi:hypothetical protein
MGLGHLQSLHAMRKPWDFPTRFLKVELATFVVSFIPLLEHTVATVAMDITVACYCLGCPVDVITYDAA